MLACCQSATRSTDLMTGFTTISTSSHAQRVSAARELANSLLAAEKEVFHLLVSGPVFHLVVGTAFATWAKEMVAREMESSH